jgi:ankyrin repeat protein
LGPWTSTQNVPLQEERIEVGFDRTGFPRIQRYFQRIFEVVEFGDHKALSHMLNKRTTNVKIIDIDDNTLLHHAVASACRKDDWDDSLYQCINLLMSCEQMQVNRPNDNGYTAIGLAVHKRHKTCVEHMLKHPLADRLYLDYYPGDSESTVREVIKQTYSDLEPLLPPPLMESLDSSEWDIKLLAALQHDEYLIFVETLDPNNPNPWYDEPYHSSLLEIACQTKDRKRFVKHLLDNGAALNITNRVTGVPLLHATARSGNFGLLRFLLLKDREGKCLKDNEQRTIFHWLAQVRERKPGDKYILESCFKVLLDSHSVKKTDIDFRDFSGNTALYIALHKGFRDRAELLLSEVADVNLIGNACPVMLPTTLPVLEEILDDCLWSNGMPLTSENLQLRLKKKLLTNIIPHIVESQHLRELLKHPVISTFLFLKWLKFRHIFFIDMAFYLTFLCLLTAYILYSDFYNTVNDRGAVSKITGAFSFNDSNITSDMSDSNFTSQPNSSSLGFVRLFLLFTLVFLTLRETMQLRVCGRDYIKSLENWLEISLIIATFLSCSGVVENVELKLHFSAVALLLGWSEMLMMSGRLPQLSVQLAMLRTVSVTFLRFMAGYVTLLLAFALSFYILFKGNSEQRNAEMFANPPISLLRTIVMFTGEFDASSLSFGTLPYTSHVIFLLFVVLVAIVLLNLLNGLAVNDTGEIRRDAERLSLVARAELISRIERFVNALPKFMKLVVERKEETYIIYPNKRNRIGPAAVRSLLSIISERKPNQKEKSTGIQEEWSLFAKKLSALELRQKKLEEKLHLTMDGSRQMFEQILARLNIPECVITHHEF